MAKSTSVTLGNHFGQFISQKINSGRYDSASELLRASLCALEDQESKSLNLRNILIQGEQSETVTKAMALCSLSLIKIITNEKIVLSVKAKSDVTEIVKYTQLTWRQAQHNNYLKITDNSFQLLADEPELRINCD
ncbi:type II toxin-antitoxin system ParD family antitoxin [Psychromonas sp. SR45-3]|uniref:type II toxin-antitoxin system ParD family antitoxin n=1 Tax=Psychromonas sp. SR45-3 TaxID=2760930 RepID=UPI0021760A53|nr:type II toxin-antitoxin system ParD family antitoxin [Psychromonas sp. SR45-3]